MTAKEKKAAYDREYREKNRELLKLKHHEYFKRTYDPVKAAKERKKKMPKHVEYCRQEWYRQYKKEYDKKRRSSRFGEYAECHLLLVELIKEINKQMPDRFARYAQAQRHGWSPLTHERRRQKHAEQNITNISLDGL